MHVRTARDSRVSFGNASVEGMGETICSGFLSAADGPLFVRSTMSSHRFPSFDMFFLCFLSADVADSVIQVTPNHFLHSAQALSNIVPHLHQRDFPLYGINQLGRCGVFGSTTAMQDAKSKGIGYSHDQ